MNITKSTKNRVNDKVWLNKTWKLGDHHPSFRQCVFESWLNIETKIDTLIVL